MIKAHSGLKLISAAAVATVALSVSAFAAEKTLTSVSGLQPTNILTQSYLQKYVKVLNSVGDGLVKIKYLGGQEVVPPDKAAAAIKRGTFDMLSSPSSYYIGTVPEAYALLASNQGPRVLRTNGGWELLQKVFAEKAGAYLLSWGANLTSYHMYLWKEPKLGPDGVPDLKGFKMRATGTYRPLFRALGAATVNIPSSEVITAVQRGTVDGFGFTDVSLPAIGLHQVVKYRIKPNFYQTNTVETINLDVWKSLTQAQKDLMTRMAIEFEMTSVQFIEAERLREEADIKKAGIKDVVLKPEAAAKYLEIAHGEIWKELEKRSTYTAQLKPLLYKPGKANRQMEIEQKLDEKR